MFEFFFWAAIAVVALIILDSAYEQTKRKDWE